jgi:hypothetical protein
MRMIVHGCEVEYRLPFLLVDLLKVYYYTKVCNIKGIFQPFELGGVTRLIPSAVKFCEAGH